MLESQPGFQALELPTHAHYVSDQLMEWLPGAMKVVPDARCLTTSREALATHSDSDVLYDVAVQSEVLCTCRCGISLFTEKLPRKTATTSAWTIILLCSTTISQ